jgi:hypothetical protein
MNEMRRIYDYGRRKRGVAYMENMHTDLDTSTGSKATMNEQGMLSIRAYETELGTQLGHVSLNAQETWILLQWLYGHADMLHQLTHPDQDVTTKLRAVDQQGKPRVDIEVDDAEAQAHQDWSNDE